MNRLQIFEQIKQKQSFLCVGLDTDIQRVPKFLLKFDDPIFEFNKQIVAATRKYAIAYKLNTAFYESQGAKGWQSLEKTAEYIKKTLPNVFLIADAKRGDIGNTSKMYAKTFFEHMNFDALTVAPYMGSDSVEPFLEFHGKFVILLALTSNAGAQDFQFLKNSDTTPLYAQVLKQGNKWANADKMMYVIGATKADKLQKIRNLAPDNFLLIPGVGAQGGSLQAVAQFGFNAQCGLLVNSSRGIIYAGNDKLFAQKAGQAAQILQEEMSVLLEKFMPAN